MRTMLPYRSCALRICEAFSAKRVLVIGDVMLDRYIEGTVTRISPEAPVPVVLQRQATLAPGGAANVAANIAGLGGRAVLTGLVGCDLAGKEFMKVLRQQEIDTSGLFADPSRPMTVKTRVVAHRQQIVRIDQESIEPVCKELEERVAAFVEQMCPDVDSIVVSDYSKGLLSPTLLHSIINSARLLNKPVIIDPKGKDYGRYSGATLITPNRAEAAMATGTGALGTEDAVQQAGSMLLDELDVHAVLITEGEEGLTLFERGQPPYHLPTLARSVYDVTGAGDAVVATLGLAVPSGASLIVAAQLANLVAGLAVEQFGTVAVRYMDLLASVKDRF